MQLDALPAEVLQHIPGVALDELTLQSPVVVAETLERLRRDVLDLLSELTVVRTASDFFPTGQFAARGAPSEFTGDLDKRRN